MASRDVTIMAGLITFTNCRRRLRYPGSQLARATVPETTSHVVVNALESHFVAGHLRQLANCKTECIRTMQPGSVSASIGRVTSYNIKAVRVSLITAYIFLATSSGPVTLVGDTTSIK